MSMLSVGRIVQLHQAVEGENQAAFACKSRIADVEENRYIALEIPIDEENGRMRFIPKDTLLFVSFIDAGGGRNWFQTKVLGYRRDNVPLLLVEYPDPETILKEQRRNFFRVEAQTDIAVRFSDLDRTYHFLALTVDISGGGLSFACDRTYRFQQGDVLDIWMVLPLQGRIHRLHCQGEVVRIRPPQEDGGKQTVSIKFLSLKEGELQKIMRFCYERELELRKKGIR